MEIVYIDWVAVVIAAVLNMVIGFFWYSKWLFGTAWLKLSKSHEKHLKGDRASVVYGFVVSLVIAYFLAFFEAYLGVTTVTDGMFVAGCFWLGFVATTQISSVIWGRRPWKLFLLNAGCKLLSYLVMGGIIGA